MIVLTAIGRFFKKIWDWIRQTAWIQPLLIVGVIFGVIFSIPAIVKAVKANNKEKNTYYAYYNKFKYSLTGERNSKADKITRALDKIMKGEDGSEAAFKKEYPKLGEKFFLAYVAKDCDKCEDAKEGFSTFESKLNKENSSLQGKNDKQPFNFVTIFTDDENADTKENRPAFFEYLDKNFDFFANVGNVAYEAPYYAINKKSEESALEALETADPKNFLTPTIFLVEIGETAKKNGQFPGVTEVMFGVEGENKTEKAKTLLNCWNHTGDFNKDSHVKE